MARSTAAANATKQLKMSDDLCPAIERDLTRTDNNQCHKNGGYSENTDYTERCRVNYLPHHSSEPRVEDRPLKAH